MKKIIILLSVCACFGFDSLTVPNDPQDSSIIRAADFRENNDSLESWTGRLADTIPYFIRYNHLNDRDSTLDTIQIDNIRSNPDIDSICGNPRIDSASIGQLSADSATLTVGTITTADINGGAIDGTTIGASSASTGVFTTVNTGQGAYELYAMNQDVETSDNVTFNKVSADSAVFSYNEFTTLYLDTMRSNPFFDSIGLHRIVPPYDSLTILKASVDTAKFEFVSWNSSVAPNKKVFAFEAASNAETARLQTVYESFNTRLEIAAQSEGIVLYTANKFYGAGTGGVGIDTVSTYGLHVNGAVKTEDSLYVNANCRVESKLTAASIEVPLSGLVTIDGELDMGTQIDSIYINGTSDSLIIRLESGGTEFAIPAR